jgi:hypothetical protein
MNPKTIKKRIQTKFGNVKNFSRLTGVSYVKITNSISGRYSEPTLTAHLDIINHLVEVTRPEPEPNDIPDGLREIIRVNILTNFGSFRNFIIKHPQFSACFLSAIKTGKKRKMDKKFILLCKVLKIKI